MAITFHRFRINGGMMRGVVGKGTFNQCIGGLELGVVPVPMFTKWIDTQICDLRGICPADGTRDPSKPIRSILDTST